MKLRNFRRSYVDDLVGLFKETFKFHSRFDDSLVGLSKSDIEERRQSFLKTIGKKLERIFVLEVGGKVIGYVWGGIKSKKGVRVGVVYDIIVTSGYRGKGLGKRLLEEMISFFKKNDCEKVKLSAFAKNRNARKMYKGMGFEDVQVIYQMEKKI